MRSRGFIVLWLAMMVAMIGISMVSPLLPVHVQDDLGGPAVAVALSFSGLTIAQIIFAPFVGRLGDVFGPKPFIVIGFSIYALGAVGYLFSPTWELVIFFRVLSGVGAAAVFPMALAYVGRLAPRGDEGRFMGWFSVAQTAGFGIGPLFGGGLRDLFSADVAFATMSALLGGTALMTAVLLPPQPPGEPLHAADREAGAVEGSVRSPSFWSLMRRPDVQATTLLALLVSMGWGSASVWLAVYVIGAEGLGTNSALFAGILLASRSLINAVFQPLTGPLADRTNRVMLVVIGLVLSGIAQFVVPLLPRWIVETSFLGAALTMAPWVLVAMVAAGLAESLATPAQQAIFVQIGRGVGMGALMGIASMGNAIGFLGGSLIGAFVKDAFGIASVFYAAGIITVGGAIVFALLARRAGGDLDGVPPLEAEAARVAGRA
ncbi:MAG: MFS transporter [Dehalococcoidia bacterium]|nr:MFS transporter [Dehalococcoidia bacterium]